VGDHDDSVTFASGNAGFLARKNPLFSQGGMVQKSPGTGEMFAI